MEKQEVVLGWKVTGPNAKFPEKKTFIGRYVLIQPLDPAKHTQKLFQNFKQTADLWTYLFDSPCSSAQEYQLLLQKKLTSSDSVPYVVYKTSDITDPVGMFSLMRISTDHRCIEIGGITFSFKLQKSSASTEVLYLMAKYVFQELNFVRFQWKCNALNKPSVQSALRFGFTFEGRFRKHMIIKGYSRDTMWFAIIVDQWPEIKKEYQRWLDRSNFTETGSQKTKLNMPTRNTII